MEDERDLRGRFKSQRRTLKRKQSAKQSKFTILIDHQYANVYLCDGEDCKHPNCRSNFHIPLPPNVKRHSWKKGRRLVELYELLCNLRACQSCRLGPVPLMYNNIVGEYQKGLSGYLYVVCQNPDCCFVNRVPYGKTHHIKARGMPCFVINTKLGAAMIDNLGGPDQVNNLLAVLNLKTINSKNLKKMETRAGNAIEAVSRESSKKAAKEAFEIEMSEIAQQETEEAREQMVGEIDGLGVCPLPGESPSLQLRLQSRPEVDSDYSADEDDVNVEHAEIIGGNVPVQNLQDDTSIEGTPKNTAVPDVSNGRSRRMVTFRPSPKLKSKKMLLPKFPCRTRTGMSTANDTAWQKKGFDSLTSHTFFMTTKRAGKKKKVIKTVVGHRHCGVCKWWKRNKPGKPVRSHNCVKNHTGSARSMEATGGLKGVRELFDEGTPIEYLEGDGDNTLIARIKNELNISLKKRFDKNHVVKNITGALYKMKKDVNLSNSIINHIEKCLCYTFQKNQGNREGMVDNLRALIPHQFADHSFCHARFCGYKRNPTEKYMHRSLPYMAPLHDSNLKSKLQAVFDSVLANVDHYTDLGSSQQCESANRSVSMRAPKSHYFGDTKGLDYRVLASAACINEGRDYLSQGFLKLGLSPGEHTTSHSEKYMKKRQQRFNKSQLPSTKRRRLVLKKERATIQGASEAMEGDTYQSGIGHVQTADIEKIPDPVSRASFKPVTISSEPTIITLDLETTGLIENREMPHITQIAATETTSGKSFNCYVKPTIPITPEATRVTGISCNNDQLRVKGQLVQSVGVKDAVNQMLLWLQQFESSAIVVCAHNGRRFDFPILLSLLKKLEKFPQFSDQVCGLVDTMSIFRKLFPKSSLKQVDLATMLLKKTYDAHNAIADVVTLGELIHHVNLSDKEFKQHTFSPEAVLQNLDYNNAKAANLPTLDVLVYSGICKRPTAENVAGSGLNLHHLRLIYQRGGVDGLRDIFTSKNNNGLPRVTNSKKVLEEFIPKLSEYFSK